MVYYIQPSLASDDSIVRCQECFLYIYTGVGLSALLVSTGRAMRRPLHCGTSDRIDSTLFRMYKSKLLTVRTGAIGQNIIKPMEKSEPLSPDKIRSGQELIKSKIFERAKKLELSNDGLEPLPDGVADIEGYCKSSPRIMWILKQPYDDMKDGKPFGGGWEVYGAFNNDDAFKNTTWQPIIYSLFGIRNHKLYGDSEAHPINQGD